MSLPDGIEPGRFDRLVELAREEDFGVHGDVTTALLPPPRQLARGAWLLAARQDGRFCGRSLLEPLLSRLAPDVEIDENIVAHEGAAVKAGDPLARLAGSAVQMLAAERTLLNFLQRLSGIASLTRRYVDLTTGTHARVFDTRKTTPGWRDLERYAVRVGGGHNHRSGLFDAVLIKDNHLAGIPTPRLAHAIFEMLNGVGRLGVRPRFVEVEVDALDQLDEVLKVVGVDVVLLDNFSAGGLREAVARRDRAGLRGKLELEASGGVTLETVAAVAQSGVERIAIGAITHSAVALDLGLDAIA